MKIDSSAKPAASPLARDVRAPAPEKTAPKGDEVQLSAASAQLGISGASGASGDSAIFDSARVSEIKQAISEGRFNINAGAIADRLIATARELVDAQRQA